MTMYTKNEKGQWTATQATLPDLCDACGQTLAVATTPDGMGHCRSLACCVSLIEQGFQLDDNQVDGAWIWTRETAMQNAAQQSEDLAGAQAYIDNHGRVGSYGRSLCTQCGDNEVDSEYDEACWWCLNEANPSPRGVDYWSVYEPEDTDCAWCGSWVDDSGVCGQCHIPSPRTPADLSEAEIERIPARRAA